MTVLTNIVPGVVIFLIVTLPFWLWSAYVNKDAAAGLSYAKKHVGPGVLIFVIALAPWYWSAYSTDFMPPLIGMPATRISIAAVALIVMGLGIRATVKGYGQQPPAENSD